MNNKDYDGELIAAVENGERASHVWSAKARSSAAKVMYGVNTRQPREVICQQCGTRFIATNSRAKYCSASCRYKAFLAVKKSKKRD